MTLTARKTRCSALPLIWRCSESQNAAPDEPLLNQSSEPAEIGSAFHRWMAAHMQGITLEHKNLADEYECDLNELQMLCNQGRRALGELKKYITTESPLIEHRLCFRIGELEVIGTADVLFRNDKTAVVIDWKTGRLDSDYAHQVRGYAKGAVEAMDADDACVITVWVRQGIWDIEKISRTDLESWAADLEVRIRNGRGSFNPGSHCQYCQRQASCPGRRALVHSVMADLSVNGANVIEWTAETRNELGPQIGEQYGRIKMIESLCEAFRETLKADIKQSGDLLIGGGRKLHMVDVNRRKLDPPKARNVLRGHLSDEEIDRCTVISASQVDSIVAQKAGKGQGASAKRQLETELLQAGALQLITTTSLKEGRA